MPQDSPRIAKKDNSFIFGVTLMLFSGLGFALVNLFIRNLLVFLVALVTLIHQQRKTNAEPLFLDKRDLRMLIIRSILGTIGLIANFYAVDHLPLANASVLNKLSPFFTVIFAAIFLKERVSNG